MTGPKGFVLLRYVITEPLKKNTIECVSKSESQVLHPLNCFSGAYNAKNPETQGKKSETVLPVKYIVKLGAGEAGGRRGTNTCPC